MSNTDDLLANNEAYAASFDKADLPLPPAKKVAVIACMDARLNVYGALGLTEGDAHVIRNAGGRASDDAIRSLVISYKLLGTNEFFVIHHTECGMLYFTNEKMREMLATSLETAQLTAQGFQDVGHGPGSPEGNYIEWLTFKDARQAVLDDVARIKTHPLIPKTIPVHGYIYDVKTGKLAEVEGAKSVGVAG
jgi:carbonic anhydrase